MLRRTIVVVVSGLFIMLLAGCTLEASLEDQGGDPSSAEMLRIAKDSSDFSEVVVSEKPDPEPSAEPTEIEATDEPTEESTEEATETPQPTTTNGVSAAAAGNRSQRTPQPTPTSPNDTPYATQCLEYKTGLVTSDLQIQRYPGVEYVNDLVGPALYPGDVVTLIGWWNDGTNPWWQIDYSGFRGPVVGWIPGFSVSQQELSNSACTLYWPYIERVIGTPTPMPTAISVTLGMAFQVAPYEIVSLDNGNISVRVTFINDTRCLPNTECPDPGSAVVDVEISSGGATSTQLLILEDGVDPSTVFNGYRITLLAVNTFRADPSGPPTSYYITLVVHSA